MFQHAAASLFKSAHKFNYPYSVITIQNHWKPYTGSPTDECNVKLQSQDSNLAAEEG
jgi:hypothetical protein